MDKNSQLNKTPFTWIIVGIVLSFSETAVIVNGEAVPLEQYLGCFYDNVTQSSDWSEGKSLDAASLTIEKCIKNCRDHVKAASHARIENGTVCKCGNNSGTQLEDSLCNSTCSGNSSQYCGGTYQDSVPSYVLYSVCPIGTYGPRCLKVCHCKQPIPCHRHTGMCPNNECHENYTGAQCDTQTSFSDQYIGCYKDVNLDQSMEHRNKSGLLGSLNLCLGYCSSNYSFSGPQYYDECHCGESYHRHGPLNESSCNTNCTRNPKQKCGGGNAISVYHSCPSGNYGPNCAKICNCESRCYYKNGTCKTGGCKIGWTGDKCNLRDCRQNNGACSSSEVCITVEPILSTNVSVCRCPKGFRRQEIWKNCTDVDECSEQPSICGPYAQSCINVDGGFRCQCKNGIIDNSACNSESTESDSNVGTVLVTVFSLLAILFVIIILYMNRSRLSLLKKNFGRKSKMPVMGIPSRIPSTMDTHIYDHVAVYDTAAPVKAVSMDELPYFIMSKLSEPGLLDKEFQRVPQETKDPCNVGKDRNLKGKNRFKNIVPYDHNRVILKKIRNVAHSDYINASHIAPFNKSDKIIATQGPKPETVDDFWRMVCEQDAEVIVMITNLVENRKVKCEQYWADVGGTAMYGEISVNTISEEIWKDYTSRKINVSTDTKNLNVVQWHFLHWPDHGVPSDANSFLNFRRRVRKSMKPGKSVIVHCSAGAGRTGCFIAVDYLLEQGRIEGQVDIFGCFQHLRQMRCQMVQTLDQYQFIHGALLLSSLIGETTISNEKFGMKLNELRQITPPKELSPLDIQYQVLKDPKQDIAGIDSSSALTNSLNSDQADEFDAKFTWGWKAKDAFITMNVPSLDSVNEFYSFCREFKCRTIIFIDTEKVPDRKLFSSNAAINLQQHIVTCESQSKEEFGISYRISERKLSNDTYANVGQFDIYANTGGEPDKREINLLHLTESINDETIGFQSLVLLHRKLKRLEKGSDPIIVISRNGFLLTGYCLAALNAFDMSADEKEVDVFQVVQEIRKSRQQFDFSLFAFKELYSMIGKFIEVSGKSNSRLQ